MKKVAVIGANGFLGRRIVQRLADRGYAVIGVEKEAQTSTSGCARCVSTERFLKDPHDPAAVIIAAGSYLDNSERQVELNCEVVYGAQKACPGSKIVFVSSTNVYGNHAGVIREQSSYNKPSPYGMAKLAGEFIVSAAKKYSILRLTYLYGPGLNNKSFLPIIMKQAVTNRKIVLGGDGSREQDYLFVDDAAAMCVKAMEHHANDIFLGATGRSLSNLAVAEAIRRHVPGCTIEFTDEKQAGTSFRFDPSSTLAALDWRPETEFDEGIARYFS
jgi:UDP-glucose 4-epimerase